MVKSIAQDRDQYFTKEEVAKQCYETLHDVMERFNIDTSKYTFIEPSAGQCAFFQLLPKERRIGIDIEPAGKLKDEIIQSDYLYLRPPTSGKYIVIGNPPFGFRGRLALAFIHHSWFADVVAFILPPLFASTGKGVAGTRVKGFDLAYSEKLKPKSFVYPNGNEVDVETVFQVWIRHGITKIPKTMPKTCYSFIKILSVSDGGTPSSTRNKNMHDKCDAYLPSTVFSGMKLYHDFENLPYRRGYGILFLKDKDKLMKIFNDANWEEVAFKSTNGALNLRTDLIQNLVIKEGCWDLIYEQG